MAKRTAIHYGNSGMTRISGHEILFQDDALPRW